MKSFARFFDWFKNRRLTVDISAKEIAAYCTIVPLVYLGGCDVKDFMYRALGYEADDFKTTVLKQYKDIKELMYNDTVERDVQYKAILEWDRKCAYVPFAHIEDGLKSLKNDCSRKWKIDAWKIQNAAEKLSKQIEDLELFLDGEKGED